MQRAGDPVWFPVGCISSLVYCVFTWLGSMNRLKVSVGKLPCSQCSFINVFLSSAVILTSCSWVPSFLLFSLFNSKYKSSYSWAGMAWNLGGKKCLSNWIWCFAISQMFWVWFWEWQPSGRSEEHYDKMKSQHVRALYLLVQIFSWKPLNLK